jgi:hypothetical protein
MTADEDVIAGVEGVSIGNEQWARVWKELMSRDRKTGRFQYPTTFDLGYGTEEQRQCFAIDVLMHAALEPPPPVITRKQRNTMRGQLLTAAETLREAVIQSKRLGLRSVEHQLGSSPKTDPWIQTAEELEDMADFLDRTALVVERDRGMLFERAKAVQLARMSQLFFGKVLPQHTCPAFGAGDWPPDRGMAHH